jgi:hypothetical protein
MIVNKKIYISFLLILWMGVSLQAQDWKKIVQVSGLVVSGDSLYGVPGVSVYIPKTGRGTNTNYVGYFSLPALAGDSIIINSLGFKARKYLVPDTIMSGKMSLIIELMEDTLMLPTVEIFPWPTEQLFKEAFLALKLPEQDMNNMNQNLNEQVLKRMLYTSSAAGGENYRYYMQKQMHTTDNRYTLVSPELTFLNPFAWSRFITDVKKKRFKSNMQERHYDDDDE